MASLSFLIAALFHCATHRKWYKAILKNGMGRKSKVTAVLSVLFGSVSVTGIALLGIEGANSAVGLWHYKIGIVTLVLSAGHLLKRFPVLKKSLKRG